MQDERVVVFIDGSNLYMGLRQELPNTRIDMGRFAVKLCGVGRQLVRTYYYYAPVDQVDDPDLFRMQQPFLKALRNIPYFQVQLGRLERRPTGQYMEKGIDVIVQIYRGVTTKLGGNAHSLWSRLLADSAVVVPRTHECKSEHLR